MNRCELLKKSEVFNILDEHECKAVANLCEEREVNAGTILGKEGEKAFELYLVVDGQLEITTNAALAEPMPVTIATVDALKVAGWSSMYAGGKLTATIKTSKHTKLLVWEAQKLHNFFMQNCGMGYRILQQILSVVVAKRLKRTRISLLSCVMDNH